MTERIATARESLEREQERLRGMIEDYTRQLKGVEKALRALSAPPSPKQPRRPNKRTGTVEEYIQAVGAALDSSPSMTREQLNEAVREKMATMGRSRIAANVRISQALKRLNRSVRE